MKNRGNPLACFIYMNEGLFTVFVENECELNKQRVSIYAELTSATVLTLLFSVIKCLKISTLERIFNNDTTSLGWRVMSLILIFSTLYMLFVRLLCNQKCWVKQLMVATMYYCQNWLTESAVQQMLHEGATEIRELCALWSNWSSWPEAVLSLTELAYSLFKQWEVCQDSSDKQ